MQQDARQRSHRARLWSGAAVALFITLAAAWVVITSLVQHYPDLRDLGWRLALLLTLLGLLLSGAAGLLLYLGFRPLTRMRESIDALKENSAARLPADLPSEFQPLVSSIAELLDAREQDLATVRRRSMDLARGLRSPLAAMSAGSRRAREAGAANAAEGLDRAIATATAAVSRELEHSRVTPNRHATRHFHTAARFAVERAISAVEPQGSSAEQLFEVDVPDDLFLPVAPENLAELLGAILDNAVRFAKARVKISGAVTENAAVLVIEDDGPGLGPYHAAQVTSRRGSLDEAAASEKLSVAREWVEATRGQLTLGDAAIGGLKVQIDWPAAKR